MNERPKVIITRCEFGGLSAAQALKSAIHLMYIVQFQSRIIVFIKWAIKDLTFSRGARLITGDAATDFDFNHEIGCQSCITGPESRSVTVSAHEMSQVEPWHSP